MSKELNDVLEAFNRAKSEKAQADAMKAQMAEQALLMKMLLEQSKEYAKKISILMEQDQELIKQSKEHYENNEAQDELIIATHCATFKAFGLTSELCN